MVHARDAGGFGAGGRGACASQLPRIGSRLQAFKQYARDVLDESDELLSMRNQLGWCMNSRSGGKKPALPNLVRFDSLVLALPSADTGG